MEPTLPVFRGLFSICTHAGDYHGWYNFKLKGNILVSGRMSTSMEWTDKFFFVRAPASAPWQSPVKWDRPTRNAVGNASVGEADQMDMDSIMRTIMHDHIRSSAAA